MSLKIRSSIEKYISIKEMSLLEIGAYNSPTYTKDQANIKFLDIQPKEALIKDSLYFNYDTSKIVNVDYLVNDSNYDEYVHEKFDCIIADNVFEHVSNPIKWLITQSKLLNESGFIFIRLPAYDKIFDKFRSRTDFAHIVTDYIRDVPDLDPVHCVESSIYYNIDIMQNETIQDRLTFDRIKYWYDNPHFGIHCHCFDSSTFIDKIMKPILMTGLVDLSIIEQIVETDSSDFIVVLKKSTPVTLTTEDFLKK